MGTISSSPFDVRSGTGTIDITEDSIVDGLVTGFTTSETFKVSDIGSISTKDIEDEEEIASNVYLNLGELSFSAFDRLSGGSSLFEVLDALSASDDIEIAFNFTTNAGRSWTDTFWLNIEDMEYNRRKREVSFESNQRFLDSVDKSLTDFFTNDIPSDVETYDNLAGNTSNDCVSCKDFINGALGLLNSNITGSNIINTSNYFSEADDKSQGGDIHYVVVDWASVQQTNVKENLFRLAAMDGSLVGSMMGYSFFSYRENTSDSVTISESDVKDLDIMVGLEAYFNIKVVVMTLTGTSAGNPFAAVTDWAGAESLTGDADGLNSEAAKTLNVFLDNRRFGKATWTGTIYQGEGYDTIEREDNVYTASSAPEGSFVIDVDDGAGGSAPLNLSAGDFIYFDGNLGEWYEVEDQSSSELTLVDPLRSDIQENVRATVLTTTAEDDGIAQGAANAYASSYGGNGSRRIKISVFGIDTIKPHQTFQLDSSFPDLLQNQTFRPDNLEYDFEKDVINIEAYRVA